MLGREPRYFTRLPGGTQSRDRVIRLLLALASLQLLHYIVNTYALIFDESWRAFTTPGEPQYDPRWKLVVGTALLMRLALVPLLAAVLVSFARKRKAFIRLAILWLIVVFLAGRLVRATRDSVYRNDARYSSERGI